MYDASNNASGMYPSPPRRFRHIDFRAVLAEFRRLLRHGSADFLATQRVVAPARVIAHLLANLHGAEFRPAHRAEMRDLRAVRGQRLVVEGFRRLRVHGERELVAPAEFE